MAKKKKMRRRPAFVTADGPIVDQKRRRVEEGKRLGYKGKKKAKKRETFPTRTSSRSMKELTPAQRRKFLRDRANVQLQARQEATNKKREEAQAKAVSERRAKMKGKEERVGTTTSDRSLKEVPKKAPPRGKVPRREGMGPTTVERNRAKKRQAEYERSRDRTLKGLKYPFMKDPKGVRGKGAPTVGTSRKYPSGRDEADRIVDKFMDPKKGPYDRKSKGSMPAPNPETDVGDDTDVKKTPKTPPTGPGIGTKPPGGEVVPPGKKPPAPKKPPMKEPPKKGVVDSKKKAVPDSKREGMVRDIEANRKAKKTPAPGNRSNVPIKIYGKGPGKTKVMKGRGGDDPKAGLNAARKALGRAKTLKTPTRRHSKLVNSDLRRLKSMINNYTSAASRNPSPGTIPSSQARRRKDMGSLIGKLKKDLSAAQYRQLSDKVAQLAAKGYKRGRSSRAR